MKISFLSKIAIIAIIPIILGSCNNNKNHFTIEGKISNADKVTLYLERRSLTETNIIDSVKTDKDGNFKFSSENPGYPEFYNLKLDGQTISLAVDSTETITVNSTKDAFATAYSVQGSEGSDRIKEVVFAQNKLSNSFLELKKKYDAKEITQEAYVTAVQDAIEEYKSKAKAIIFSDYKSLAAYFALFQKVDGYLIFDPYDKKDLAAFQAVATVWDQYKPQSPRTEHLKNFTLQAIAEVRNQASQKETISKLENAPLTESESYFDISLRDKDNKEVSLSSLRGKTVILDFTAYDTDYSPGHNIYINKVYSKHASQVEVYQVSFDKDPHLWVNTAKNLPWVCVRDPKSLTSQLIPRFNIERFPTTFLINKKGEIVKRLEAKDDLGAEIQKIL